MFAACKLFSEWIVTYRQSPVCFVCLWRIRGSEREFWTALTFPNESSFQMTTFFFFLTIISLIILISLFHFPVSLCLRRLGLIFVSICKVCFGFGFMCVQRDFIFFFFLVITFTHHNDGPENGPRTRPRDEGALRTTDGVANQLANVDADVYSDLSKMSLWSSSQPAQTECQSPPQTKQPMPVPMLMLILQPMLPIKEQPLLPWKKFSQKME